jgi:hypothetical protein
MRKLLVRWFFVFATFNIWIASLIEETETAAMLVWFYEDMVSGAKEIIRKGTPK